MLQIHLKEIFKKCLFWQERVKGVIENKIVFMHLCIHIKLSMCLELKNVLF